MKNKRGIIFIIIGIACILSAIVLTARNFWLTERAGEAANDILSQLTQEIPDDGQSKVIQGVDSNPVLGTAPEIPDFVLDPQMEMPVATINGADYIGYLFIPSLDLTLPIGAGWDMTSLERTPCRYAGSAYRAGFVIAGHNYATHFGSLSHLAPGDSVVFTDVDGNVFTYCVASLDTLDATAVEAAVTTEFDLTLFTCTVGGKFRICVRCSLSDTQSNSLADQS